MFKTLISLTLLSTTNAHAMRGSSTDDCIWNGETIRESSGKYLIGNEETRGSIYAHCRQGELQCHLEDGAADRKNKQIVSCEEASSHRNLGVFESNRAWPGGVVCYQPLSNNFTTSQKEIIERALDHFNEKTNLKMISLDDCTGTSCGNCQNAIGFFKGVGCRAMIGYQAESAQELSLADSCFNSDIWTPVHEIGHAIGLHHEHRHPNRSVIIIESQLGSGYTAEKFSKKTDEDIELRPYDAKSVMHYDFKDGICVPKQDASLYCDIEQTEADGCIVPTADECDEAATQAMQDQHNTLEGLSQGDIDAINFFYAAETGISTPTPAPVVVEPEAPTPAPIQVSTPSPMAVETEAPTPSPMEVEPEAPAPAPIDATPSAYGPAPAPLSVEEASPGPAPIEIAPVSTPAIYEPAPSPAGNGKGCVPTY